MKMQEVSFSDVNEFLDFLPDDERKIVDKLRKIIFDCAPEAVEKLSYNVPFYKQHRNVCFIWPSTVLWGKTKTYSGVRLGFSNGYLLNDEIQYLQKGKRKQVYWRDFTSTGEIDPDLLKSYIFEALSIDKNLQKKSASKIDTLDMQGTRKMQSIYKKKGHR